MRVIIVPDDGREYVLVPVEPTNAHLDALKRHADHITGNHVCYAELIAVAPPAKVIELPERCDVAAVDGDYGQGRIDGYNEYLDEIERRAKG